MLDCLAISSLSKSRWQYGLMSLSQVDSVGKWFHILCNKCLSKAAIVTQLLSTRICRRSGSKGPSLLFKRGMMSLLAKHSNERRPSRSAGLGFLFLWVLRIELVPWCFSHCDVYFKTRVWLGISSGLYKVLLECIHKEDGTTRGGKDTRREMKTLGGRWTKMPFVQDNAATMKVQLDAQKKATDQLVSNTR